MFGDQCLCTYVRHCFMHHTINRVCTHVRHYCTESENHRKSLIQQIGQFGDFGEKTGACEETVLLDRSILKGQNMTVSISRLKITEKVSFNIASEASYSDA